MMRKVFGMRAGFVGAGLAVVLLTGGAIASEMGGHGPRHMKHVHKMLQKLDTNKDGNITRKEVTRSHDEGIKSFDEDKDSQLSLEEYEGLWLQQNRRRMVRQFQSLDASGDGRVTRSEMDEHANHLFHRLDENSDGTISAKEIREGRRHHRVMMKRRHHPRGDGEGDKRGRK
jgi:hypothetical protein